MELKICFYVLWPYGDEGNDKDQMAGSLGISSVIL